MRLQIKDIIPNPANPRVIRDEQFRKLKQSLAQFPQMLEKRPIAVTKEGGKYIALGGNQRLRALLDLKQEIGDTDFEQRYTAGAAEMETLLGYFSKGVPVVDCTELTPMQQKRFIIADNVPFGEWDWEGLANEWDVEELADWGLNVPGWEPTPEEGDEVSEEELDESAEDAEEIQTDIKLGDLFEIGPHRLLCGDSTSEADVSKLMNGRKADMVFTDPPYGMKLDADYSFAKGRSDFIAEKKVSGGKKYANVIGDHNDFSPKLILSVFNFFDYCKEVFIWGADYFAELIPNKNNGSWIVWDKRSNDKDDMGSDESFDKMFGSCFELCWSKNRHKRELARIKWAGLFGTEKEPDRKRHHPTQKPVLLAKWFFDKWGKEDDLIVDLFLGSGSTMVAAQQCGRTCYGLELDPKYCQVIVNRMQKLYPSLQIIKNGQPYATTNTTTEGE